jgi:hypothetical protein
VCSSDLVHDERLAKAALITIDALIADSKRADVEHADWSEQRARREWLAQHWPSLLG